MAGVAGFEPAQRMRQSKCRAFSHLAIPLVPEQLLPTAPSFASSVPAIRQTPAKAYNVAKGFLFES